MLLEFHSSAVAACLLCRRQVCTPGSPRSEHAHGQAHKATCLSCGAKLHMQTTLYWGTEHSVLSSPCARHRPLKSEALSPFGQPQRRHKSRLQLRSTPTSSVALLDRPAKHPHHKLQVLPRVQFSNNPKELELEELLQLFNCAEIDCGHASDKDGMLERLRLAVDHSISIVIATVAAEKLPSYSEPEQENQNGSQVDWSWVAERRRRKKRKVLAGFARVSGDCALTATIHDLVVLPELQRLGLGRRLLAKATTQVRNKYGTTDIGLAANTATYGFFRACGFDLDREESTFMALQSSEGCKTDSCGAVKSRPSLIALLDQAASS